MSYTYCEKSEGLIRECRTLAGMFPTLDKDVINDVVREKQGRYVLDYIGLFKVAILL